MAVRFLTDVIEEVTTATGLSQAFIGESASCSRAVEVQLYLLSQTRSACCSNLRCSVILLLPHSSGMIVLPIAGNACEHVAAVMMAAKNKMDLSLGIAVGSSLQISLFAIPFVVLVGWGIGKDFSLEVDLFALLVMIFR